MRIGIDGRAASNGRTGGLNTYTARLITALAEADHQNSYVIYTDRVLAPRALTDAPNFTLRLTPPTSRPIRENLTLPFCMMRDRLDVAHFPINAAPILYRGRYVITIHDLSCRERAIWRSVDLRSKARMRYEAVLSPWFMRRARLVVTDSEYSRARLLERAQIPGGKVRVIPPAAAITPTSHPNSKRPHDYNGLPSSKPFVLGVATASPRKNVRALVAAYARLRETHAVDHALVIVTADGAGKGQLVDSTLQDTCARHILVFPTVDDSTLADLYDRAALFVCPSLYEGFGMPVLEAMSFGTPVLCSNRTSLPEVVGDAGQLVDPLDIEMMAEQMYRLLTDRELRQRCSSRGLQRCRRFSWNETARQMMQAYDDAAHGALS